eukprot:4645329-Amphidinium_carterae.1
MLRAFSKDNKIDNNNVLAELKACAKPSGPLHKAPPKGAALQGQRLQCGLAPPLAGGLAATPFDLLPAGFGQPAVDLLHSSPQQREGSNCCK